MTEKKPRRYKLNEVCIRLAEGTSLYSAQPMSTPDRAAEVMRQELSQYDREVLCVVNLNSKLKPINFNIVSMGTVNQSIADIPNIFKSCLLSNASAILLMHNHPSGDPTPSREDIMVTKRVIAAGKLMGVSCVDHVIVGGIDGTTYSMRDSGAVDFNPASYGLVAENGEKIMEDQRQYGGEKTVEEVTLHFGKGTAEPFTTKDGKEMMRIVIPNADRSDHSPWASFVLPAKAVHENQYGKGLWAKIPADGNTTITKPVLAGQQDGKNIWDNQKHTVPNRELKSMVEFYKDQSRDSVLGQLAGKGTQDRKAPVKTGKSGPEL